MAGSFEKLQPEVRGPVDTQRNQEGDPAAPELEGDVLLLSSEIPLERIQATNRLKKAGAEGVMAVTSFLSDEEAESAQLVAAVRFLNAADVASLEGEAQSTIRSALAGMLGHETPAVRVEAARALQVHGPGAQRTTLLSAIGDEERRVRWAVVRHFGDHPEELDETQRSVLLTFLDAGTREEFLRADEDEDGRLTRSEFQGLDEQFRKLDRDGDNEVSLEEWVSPVPAEIRADVVALLLLLHGELTPEGEPTIYNPWLPAADQLDRLEEWRKWSESVSEAETPDEDEG